MYYSIGSKVPQSISPTLNSFKVAVWAFEVITILSSLAFTEIAAAIAASIAFCNAWSAAV